jgi:hypothetical protein
MGQMADKLAWPEGMHDVCNRHFAGFFHASAALLNSYLPLFNFSAQAG